MSKRLFSQREDKIHIFKPPCNFLFIIYIQLQKAVNDIINIFSSVRIWKICHWLFSSKTLSIASI